MTSLRALLLIVAGPLLVLTYLLVQGTAPDPAMHERTLGALRGLILDNAALQRDVLRARDGLLRNYDPLVRALASLERSAAALGAAGHVAEGEARAEIDRRVAAVVAAVRDQAALVEAFKSRNAQLQNSANYFGLLIAQLSLTGAAQERDVGSGIARLANAMLRFTGDPSPELAAALTAALDRVGALLARPGGGAEREPYAAALAAHGRLIAAQLPAVNDIVARLQAGPTAERVRAAQDAYLAAYGEAAARAGLFRVLIYAAAVALLAYVGYLLVRLRLQTVVLRQRLAFERLIASVSTQFIDLPRERIAEGIENGLARLAEHAGVDRAHIAVLDAEGRAVARTHSWFRAGTVAPAADIEALVRIAAARPGEEPGKAELARLGIRSWLSIPMAHAGRPVGFLMLATLGAEKRWPEDDVALLRTASEIFANSIARARGEVEREELEARLRKAQRLEAVGTLAGGIAHEFNNILAVILGYGEMALATLRRGARAEAHLRQIMTAGARAQGVIDQILAFSRQRGRQYRPLLAEPAIAEAIDFVRASLPATLAVEARLEAPGATILTDVTEVQQVVINLCTNAAQAMEGRGTIAVELDSLALAEGRELSHGRLPGGRYLRLRVRDSGCGIAPEIMERIFEPFFTTKAVGEGTGLGLATVHGIVAQHGGALDVESEPGAGTAFEAYFPESDAAPAVAPPSGDGRPLRGAGETILLVDDEKPLVLLGEEMLAMIGYEPVGFEGAAAALAAFRADPARFDLVLTDEVMPGMTGTELAAAVHAIRPELPVILMTGYAGDIAPEQLRAAGIREMLRKPLLSTPTSQCLARHLPRR